MILTVEINPRWFVTHTGLDMDTSGKLYICDRLTQVDNGLKSLLPMATQLCTIPHKLKSGPVNV